MDCLDVSPTPEILGFASDKPGFWPNAASFVRTQFLGRVYVGKDSIQIADTITPSK
jgi:hypothetical protein